MKSDVKSLLLLELSLLSTSTGLSKTNPEIKTEVHFSEVHVSVKECISI